MDWEPASRTAKENYHFLTSAVAPRPIAWVTTLDPATQVVNAAPFSWYNAVCGDPPMVMLAVSDRAPGVLKDTVRNVRASGEFVVHATPRGAVDAMVLSSADFPPDVSEVQALGLRTVPSRRVAPPGLADPPVRMECRLHKEVELGLGERTHLLIGEVVHFWADDAVLDARGNVDASKVNFAARMGGKEYCDTSQRFTMERPPRQDSVRK